MTAASAWWWPFARPRFDVEEAKRREQAVRRVEEVTDELQCNAKELKNLVARMRDLDNEGQTPGD